MALSANKNLVIRNNTGQSEGSLAIKTAAVVYKGAMVVARDDGLTCQPAADDTSSMFLGVAKTGPLTGDGTETCEYIYDVDAKFTSSGVTAGDIGVLIYCVDDDTVTDTNTAGPSCGCMIAYDSANTIWVQLRSGKAGAMTKAS